MSGAIDGAGAVATIADAEHGSAGEGTVVDQGVGPAAA